MINNLIYFVIIMFYNMDLPELPAADICKHHRFAPWNLKEQIKF